MAAAVPAYLPLALPGAYKRISREEGSVSYAANTTSNPLRIDQAGTLLTLLLRFSGTLTTGTTAPTLASGAPYTILKYVILTVGGGVGRVCAIPGYQLVVFERIREQDFTDGPSVPVVPSSTNTWTFDLTVPVCFRDGDLYGEWSDYTGAIFTGDPSLTVQFSVVWGSESTIISNQGSAAATLAGTLTVSSYKLDTPEPCDDPQLLAAISWSHMFIEEKAGIAITGAGKLNLDNLPTSEPKVYLRVLDTVINNAVFSNGIYASLDAQLQDMVDFEQTISEQEWIARQRRRYVTPLQAGSYCLDFSAGQRRDNWLNVENITLFKFTPVISGASLTNASMSRYSETLVPSPLARKWIAQAVAKGNWSKWQGAGQQAA